MKRRALGSNKSALSLDPVQAFKTSFTALAGEKESFFDAAILIFSPLAGLRPSRSGEALTLNFPNPAKEASSSLQGKALNR